MKVKHCGTNIAEQNKTINNKKIGESTFHFLPAIIQRAPEGSRWLDTCKISHSMESAETDGILKKGQRQNYQTHLSDR